MIHDEVFGDLSYDYLWSRNTKVSFLGKETDISLAVDGDESGEFDKRQYDAYLAFMKEWDRLSAESMQPIYEYYNQRRHELGYDVSENSDYPLIDNANDITKMLKLVGIVVPYAGTIDGREMDLTFDCTWDTENGVGVRYVDEKVVEVGFQDIAF